MSQYKVLPPYSEINTINTEYEEDSSFVNFSLSYSSDDTARLVTGGQDGQDQQICDPQSMETVVEMQNLMSERSSYIPWEQQDVLHLQQALNSQSTVIRQQSSLLPVSYATLWDSSHLSDLESQDTLDLSSTSTIPSYTPYSPPPSRLTILHPRNVVMSHPISGESNKEQLTREELEDNPVTSYRDEQEERKTRLKSRDGEEDRPCKVCREKAGKHSYYGGQACPSCRAFFRRSVQSGYNATYFCVKDGNCEVNLKSRKNCQFCRYKLCEAAGMKTTWVLTEEERKLKFDGKGKKRRSSSTGQSEDQVINIKPDDNAHLSDDDVTNISHYVAASDHWETSKVNDMDTELIRKIIRMIAFQAALGQAGQEQLKAVMITRAKKFANKIAEFHSLCPLDKSQILSHNIPLVVLLSTCSMFPTNMLWTTQLTPILGAGEVDKLNTKLNTLNVTGLDSLQMTYQQFFNTRTFNNEEEEMRFAQLVTYIGSWHQDPTELTLLSLTILFCPDMLDLTERRKVENIQLRFAVLLQNYLNQRHPTDPCLARSRFSKGMMLVTKCKEMEMMGRDNMGFM